MSDTQSNPKSPAGHRKSVTFGGVSGIFVLLVLLVLLSRVGPQFRLVFYLIMVGFAAYWYVRLVFRFGKIIGIAGVAVLGIGCASILLYEYKCHVDNEALLKTLNAYDTVTIQRRTILPHSPIYQVSLEDRITDEDLIQIASLPELRDVTHVFFDDCRVTDKSLDTVGQRFCLTYIFVESDVITDEAIRDFERRHPECSVIPYGRDW